VFGLQLFTVSYLTGTTLALKRGEKLLVSPILWRSLEYLMAD